MTQVVRSELILGGQKSGKSRRAETLAQLWLADKPQRSAVLIATAQAFDHEMYQRIERHRQDRLLRIPGIQTIEEPLALVATITAHSRPSTLIIVDCLTLWLTAQLMPPDSNLTQLSETNCAEDLGQAIDGVPTTRALSLTNSLCSNSWHTLAKDLCAAIAQAPGPLVLVGNEIGLGVIPLGQEVRAFVDALGLLNQMVAATCERVTLMCAGLPLTLKGSV